MVCPSKNLKARVLTLLFLYSGTRAHCAHCLFKGFKNCAFICFLFRNVSLCRQKERNCFYSYHSKQQTVVLQRFIYIISFSVYIYYLIVFFHYILSHYIFSVYILFYFWNKLCEQIPSDIKITESVEVFKKRIKKGYQITTHVDFAKLTFTKLVSYDSDGFFMYIYKLFYFCYVQRRLFFVMCRALLAKVVNC